MLPGRQERFIFKSMFASSKRHGLSKLSFVMEGGFRVARQARGNKKKGGGFCRIDTTGLGPHPLGSGGFGLIASTTSAGLALINS